MRNNKLKSIEQWSEIPGASNHLHRYNNDINKSFDFENLSDVQSEHSVQFIEDESAHKDTGSSDIRRLGFSEIYTNFSRYKIISIQDK